MIVEIRKTDLAYGGLWPEVFREAMHVPDQSDVSPTLRILVLSDLHQGDGGRRFDPADIGEAFDAVVIAGDCAGRLTTSLTWIAEAFAGIPVVYVPGNHDFYRHGPGQRFTIEEEKEAGQELAYRLGIHLLNDSGTSIRHVRLLGSTLWTDLRSNLHRDLSHALGDARRGMNDYRRIHRRSTTRRSRRLQPPDTRRFHASAKAFLERELSVGDNRRTVVVTHHAPSLRSLADPFDTLNHCYASDLEAEIVRWSPTLWVHGHIHHSRNYTVGSTRVLCNPLGRSEEATGFVPELIVEV